MAVSIGQAEVPSVPSGGLLVKVLCSAICGTDLKIYRGGKKVKTNILGHEFIARVAEVGEGVVGYKHGDRITVATTISCGTCCFCNNGLGNLCKNARRMGIDFAGAFAEMLVVPAFALERGNVLKVPSGLSDELAVLAEPLSCVLNGQQIAGMRPGLDVLVVGAGPIGILHGLAARVSGARKVFVSETNPNRLILARRFGFHGCINPDQEELAGCIAAETDDLGVDLAIVCSPTPKAMAGLTTMVKKGGAISVFAGFPADDSQFELDGRVIHYNELRITGASDSRPEHFVLAMRMLETFGDSFRSVITHSFAFSQANEAFGLLNKGEGLKVLLVPGASP